MLARILLHVPAGWAAIILVALGLVYQPWLGVLLGLTFTVGFAWRQWWQSSVIHDRSWKDWDGFMWGMATGGIALLVLGVFG